MSTLTLDDRVKGCLVGAAIGAELGFARSAQPGPYSVAQPMDIFSINPAPLFEVQETPGRVHERKATPFVSLGVRTYLARQGRATPEDFAALLKEDADIAGPVFAWDGVHTVQELLREGMHPRLSGLGNAPCGLIAGAMPAVGIYHLGDPEYAYLDGVELASVAQPRLGADWAALCAAAIAAAFDPNATGDRIVDAVLKLAHENNKELFYQINGRARAAGWLGTDEAFANWWYYTGGRVEPRKETNWYAFNPIYFILPLLKRYADQPARAMTLLLAGQNSAVCISPIIAGAILGAMHGTQGFPEDWRAWAEPIAAPWFPIAEVARKRLEKEAETIRVVERLTEPRDGGDSVLFDKVYGCILAGAIGNAMGSPVECSFYWEVDARYPDGITTILDPSRLEGEDDNQMAMLLVETYLERAGRPVLARHFGHTWRERLNRDHFYPLCMGNAYDLICQGWDPRITGHWSVVTGSTVMCMEPVGIYHLADPEFAVVDATAISYMYQRGLDMTMAAVLAAAVAEALRPDATVESVCDAALAAAPREKMLTFDRRSFESPHAYFTACLEIADRYTDVMAARAELTEKCLLYHPIDPLELLGFSLAMFRIARGDVRQAAIGGTNIGRDSDTIAGRAAMLSGTLHGAKNVPQDWIALFTQESLDRIRRNSARLAEFIATSKLARLRRRQEVATGSG